MFPSFSVFSRAGAALAPLLLFLGLALGAACGGDEGGRIERCGDGVCATDETEQSCARDCPSACLPGRSRCLNNVLLVCTGDGENELEQPCESGTYCTPDGCLPADGTGGDAGGD